MTQEGLVGYWTASTLSCLEQHLSRVHMATPHRGKIGPHSFWAVLVGQGSVRVGQRPFGVNFWELKNTCSIFFTKFWGVVNFGFRRSEAPKRPILEPTPMRPHSGPFLGPLPGVKFWCGEKKKWPTFGPAGSPYVPYVHFFYEKYFLRRLVF